MSPETQYITLNNVKKAASILRDVILETPLLKNQFLSEKHEANIVFKREDLQEVRSYKIRGAYHKISSLTVEELKQGVVCASAGNHAQGVAYSCNAKKNKGCYIYANDYTQSKNRTSENVWRSLCRSGLNW